MTGWLAPLLPPHRQRPSLQLPAVSAYLKPGGLVAWLPVLLISSWVLLRQAAGGAVHPSQWGVADPGPPEPALGKVAQEDLGGGMRNAYKRTPLARSWL